MTTWNEIRLKKEDDRLWELFHENSKWTRFSAEPGLNPGVEGRTEQMHVSLPVQSDFTTPLVAEQEPVDDLFHRIFQSNPDDPSNQDSISFAMLSRIFRVCANAGTHNVGVGTSLSPLELYAFISGIQDMPHGLYHFDPLKHVVQLVNGQISIEQLSEEIPGDRGSKVYFFITAMLQRTAFLGERGYRIALSESGQMTQKIIQSCAMQSLPAAPILHFYDRKLEQILGIDGVNHVLLQIVAI